MSPRTWIERIKDILACAENIELFTQGMSLESFSEDPKTIRAVAFELTTIGESARALPPEVQENYPQIPWDKMQGIRNVLVHEYFRIDEEILWKTSQEDIPRMILLLKEIISDQQSM